jgi:hypothetical protein
MGTRGPIPTPSAQRRRRNKSAGPSAKLTATRAPVPAADKHWHPIAKKVYQSIKKSAQVELLQPSDWATAYLLCESISRDLKPQVVGISERTGEVLIETIPLKGASLAAYLKGFAALGMTEGDRRRMGIELQLPSVEEEAPDAANLDEHRRRLRACK